MTPAQLTTLKTYIANNADLNVVPMNDDGNFAVAALLNIPAVPDFYVWRSAVARSEVYNTNGDGGSTWDWNIFKAQSITEQGTWKEIFMGDQAPFDKLNTRVGVGKIFTGSAQQNAQRDHILSIGRRKATRAEKVFAVAVSNPPANTGNNAGDALGATTNPAVMGFEGAVNASDVKAARELP